jgi:hypothetical protein
MASSTTVNTKSSTDRRHLRLASLEELRAEVRRLAAADRAGRIRAAGNWTTGQVLGHLAFWANAAFERPAELRVPFIMKLLGPLLRGRMLRTGMPSGVRIPKVANGTLGTERLTTDEGERRLLAAIDRLERETPPPRHMFLGRMSKDDYVQLNLRHAELHCSFLLDR